MRTGTSFRPKDWHRNPPCLQERGSVALPVQVEQTLQGSPRSLTPPLNKLLCSRTSPYPTESGAYRNSISLVQSSGTRPRPGTQGFLSLNGQV